MVILGRLEDGVELGEEGGLFAIGFLGRLFLPSPARGTGARRRGECRIVVWVRLRLRVVGRIVSRCGKGGKRTRHEAVLRRARGERAKRLQLHRVGRGGEKALVVRVRVARKQGSDHVLLLFRHDGKRSAGHAVLVGSEVGLKWSVLRMELGMVASE